jgi:Probable zinc-ribbon domain
VAKAKQSDKLLCPCCGERRSIADTKLLQAEAEWLATGAMDTRRPPGWSVEEARAGRCHWACVRCFEAGRALEGHPALQTWCDYSPYFAFIDAELQCEDCGKPFVFAAAEQRFWYETLKFWVQSRPKQCIPCRRTRRARGRVIRKEQTHRQHQRRAEPGAAPDRQGM